MTSDSREYKNTVSAVHDENSSLARIFSDMAYLYELSGPGNRFRAKAYHTAANTITRLQHCIIEYLPGHALEDIDGIGESMAADIRQYFSDGTIKRYEALKKKFPEGLVQLMQLRGLGPQTAKMLYRRFRITTAAGLMKLLRSPEIRSVKGFGDKKINRLLKELESRPAGPKRLPLWNALNVGRKWKRLVECIPGVLKAELAGSLRRCMPTVGDIDILIASDKRKNLQIMKQLVSDEHVQEVLSQGVSKASIIDRESTTQVDIQLVEPSVWGAAFLYFTGSRDHTIRLREKAREKGLKLSEYGLFAAKGRRIAGLTEQDVYQALGLCWIPPELRENTGEIDLARMDRLPELISAHDIKCDFGIRSVWSDGHDTISDIVTHIRSKFPAYEFIVLTERSKYLNRSGTQKSVDFRKQWEEIDAVNRSLGKSFVKKGVEVEILEDGTLELADEELSGFDWVTAVISSHFGQDNTRRIIQACRNPFVNAIGHPTGHLSGIRNGYPLDMKEVMEAASITSTVLEINAQPERMDMDEIWTRYARDKAVKVFIGTGSCALNEFDYMELGLSIARRAACTKANVLNTMSWSDIEQLVKCKRSNSSRRS